jgi:hypothetical protein
MSAFARIPPIARRGFGSAAALAALLFLSSPSAFAGPGAHGHGGEHLDQPPGTQAVSARPRVEAHTDLFELVATLAATELAILVDRYETNEPVLGADIEVESGGKKARAKFQADQGHYTVVDPEFLRMLATPGEHALVFTLKAGDDADLLDGTLRTASQDSHAHHGGTGLLRALKSNAVGLAIALAALGAMAGLVWMRKRRAGAAGLLDRGVAR